MKRILVAEDDAQLREVILQLLEVAGFRGVGAADGAEAFRLLEQEPFDLLLLDLWMPRMNGLEVLARLRSQPGAARVLVLTADDSPEALLRAVRDQAYQYIAKPFDPEALLESVRGALAAPAAPGSIEVVSARPTWVELLVPCERAVVERLQSFLEQLKSDLPADVRSQVGEAFRELLLNAIEWGGQLDPTRKVRIAYLRAGRMLLYRIADPGQGFRWKNLEHAAVSNPPGQPFAHLRVREERGLRAGGFGLLMARELADELLYNEKQNEVVFIKYLD